MPKKDASNYEMLQDNRGPAINNKLHLPAWLRAWGPAIVWMGVLFYLSSQQHLPQPPDPLLNTIIRKGGHMGAFGLLALFYRRGLSHAKVSGTTLSYGAWLLTALYAASDEWHQGFTPGREPTVMDWGIDMAGATLALVLQFLWQRRSAQAESKAQ